MKIISSQTFFRVLGYYNILSDYMQSKIKKLDISDLRNLGSDAGDSSSFSKIFGKIKDVLDNIYNANERIIDQVEKISDSLIDKCIDKLIKKLEKTIDETIDKMNPEAIFDIAKKYYSKYSNELIKKCKELSKKLKLLEFNPNLPAIIIPFPILPFLQLRFIPTVYLKPEFNFTCLNEKNETGAFINLSVQAEVSLSMELGFYIPGINSPVELAISVGLKGVLGAGKIGLKLDYNLNQNLLIFHLEYQLEALSLYFYVQYRFTIDLQIYKFQFQFYIVNQKLFGIYKEGHKEKKYKF